MWLFKNISSDIPDLPEADFECEAPAFLVCTGTKWNTMKALTTDMAAATKAENCSLHAKTHIYTHTTLRGGIDIFEKGKSVQRGDTV